MNGHSAEILHPGEMEFIISRRFGRLNGGAYELFGLDQASIRLGLDYGVNDFINIGVGRSSMGKHYDGFLKLQLLRQGANNTGFPFALTLFSSAAINTLRASDPERPVSFQNRLAFTYQALIARKFGERFSMQLMPSLVHFNLVETQQEVNDKIAIGVAGKYQITKNLALTIEYYYTLPGHLPAGKYNSLSFGLDLNTGSHVFQLHFTNSAGIRKGFSGRNDRAVVEWGYSFWIQYG